MNSKVGHIFPMVIWSEFRIGQYRDDDHQKDAIHFNISEAFKNFSSSAGSGDYEQLCESSNNGTIC